MTDSLDDLEGALRSAAAALSAQECARLVRDIGKLLRKSNSARITRQVTPDGHAWAPRRHQSHSIKGKMLTGYRKAAIMRTKATPTEAEVGFFGPVSRRARIHAEGLPDRVSAKGPIVKYTARPLIGISADDAAKIRALILDRVSPPRDR